MHGNYRHRTTLLIGLLGFLHPLQGLWADHASLVFEFDFDKELHGWEVSYADLPVEPDPIYELDWGHRERPDGPGNALYVAGTNRSDDLLMFARKGVEVAPMTVYAVRMQIEFPTNIPKGTFGIGGSPGESVVVKAGVMPFKPDREEELVGQVPYYRVNLDHGSFLGDGEHALLMGNLTNSLEVEEWELQIRQRSAVEFFVESSSTGKLWFWVATDSGFEGRTEMYYSYFRFELIPLTLSIDTVDAETVMLRWNEEWSLEQSQQLQKWEQLPDASPPYPVSIDGGVPLFWRLTMKEP